MQGGSFDVDEGVRLVPIPVPIVSNPDITQVCPLLFPPIQHHEVPWLPIRRSSCYLTQPHEYIMLIRMYRFSWE